MIESISFAGLSISMYYLFWLLGVVVVLVAGYYLGKRVGLTFSKSILYVVGAVILGYGLLWATSLIFGGGEYSGLNYVRIVTFLPIPILILSCMLKDSFWRVADYVSPLLALFHGVTHIGCIFPGCCHGYSLSWGLYSNSAGTTCFPIQPLEATSSIMIGVALMWMLTSGKQKGKLYAWYLFAFGGTRFLWEFLRDNKKIWHGISELAFHALAAFLLGAVALIVMKWKCKRTISYENK